MCPAVFCAFLNFVPGETSIFFTINSWQPKLSNLSGLGTFVAAFLNLCFDKDRKGRAERRKKGGKVSAHKNLFCHPTKPVSFLKNLQSKSTFSDTWYGRFLVQLLTAILQVVTAFVIAGIVWSIM